jgi:hypothetical protein
MDFLATVIEFKAYNKADQVPMDNNTNSVLFINKGGAVCYVNGLPLATNEAWGDSRNSGEVITGKFYISFAAGPNPLVHVQLTRYK